VGLRGIGWLRLAFLLAALLLSAFVASPVGAVTVDDARLRLSEAYVAVEAAEAAGGNVTVLAWRLNEAASLIDAGGDAGLVDAIRIIGEVEAAAPMVEAAGVERITGRYIVTGVALVVLAAAAVAVWFRGSRWYWGLWLRVKRGWRVERV
jgi:hypothetical protein